MYCIGRSKSLNILEIFNNIYKSIHFLDFLVAYGESNYTNNDWLLNYQLGKF